MNQKERVNDFLAAIEKVCEEYALSIAHQDHQGGFIIENYKLSNIEWLKDAFVRIDESSN